MEPPTPIVLSRFGGTGTKAVIEWVGQDVSTSDRLRCVKQQRVGIVQVATDDFESAIFWHEATYF
jgi:hypothetical protein